MVLPRTVADGGNLIYLVILAWSPIFTLSLSALGLESRGPILETGEAILLGAIPALTRAVPLEGLFSKQKDEDISK